MSTNDPLERVLDVMELIADGLDIDADVEAEIVDGRIVAEFVGDDPAVLIGHHGVMIDAIQDLAGKIAFHGQRARMSVVLDAGGYRERRRVALCAMADRAASAVKQTGERQELEPMGSHERKIVHEHLKGFTGIETYSEGREPARRLVVAPVVE